MRRTTTLLLLFVLSACSPSQTTPAGVTPDPASATTTQGRFTLGFAIDRATVRPADVVNGAATLSLLSPGSATITGPSTLIVFEFTEIGGAGRQVVPAASTDCAPQLVATSSPIAVPITKSGAVTDGPNADWLRQFLADPLTHLPKGDWDITARASFFDGKACSGQAIDLRTTVRVHVIE